MVHNGIEYGDMQLICEAYHVMQGVLGLQSEEIGQVFAGWNQGRLDSYLIEITADIFTAKDHDGNPLVEKILDVAGQKGTGKWTAVMALEQGVPLTLIGEAVFARFLSSLKDERRLAAEHLEGPKAESIPTKASLLTDLEHALYAAKIVSYAQGYMLMRTAAEEYGWDLDYGGIAQMWRGGCIIRSAFLADIKSAYEENPRLPNLLLAPYFKEQLYQTQAGWRRVVATAVAFGIPAPALSAAIAFFSMATA